MGVLITEPNQPCFDNHRVTSLMQKGLDEGLCVSSFTEIGALRMDAVQTNVPQ